MTRFSLKATILVVLTVALLFGLCAAASAASWPDLDNSLLTTYGVTAGQLAQVSSGFPDGTWQPWREVTTGQFLKMSLAAFGLNATDASAPSVTGDPYTPISREQAAAVLANLVAAADGYDLASMTADDVTAALQPFQDADAVSPDLRTAVAFAVTRHLVKGNDAHLLRPQATLIRIAGAALIIRAMGPALAVDETENGGTMTVRTGDIIQVVLKGNPTTGYSWTAALADGDTAILEQLGDPSYVPDSNLIGAGGTFTFRFKALKAGQAVLKLVYTRPWESVPALQTFSMTVKVADKPLEGTSWKLTGWSLNSINPADFTITASFKDGNMGGTSAVNGYGGDYTLGYNGAFSLGTVIHTMMAGSEPAMRAEDAYYALLGQAAEYRLSGTTLVLMDANGNQLLIFAPAA